MAVDLDPAAERERGGGERGGLLSDEEPGLAGGLDRGLLDGGDGGVEFFDGGCGDGDEAAVAQHAVAGGQVGFLMEHVVVLGGLGGVFARWAWSEMCSTFFLRMSRAAASERIGVQISENDRWMPVDSSTGDRNPGYTNDLGHSLTQSTAW